MRHGPARSAHRRKPLAHREAVVWCRSAACANTCAAGAQDHRIPVGILTATRGVSREGGCRAPYVTCCRVDGSVAWPGGLPVRPPVARRDNAARRAAPGSRPGCRARHAASHRRLVPQGIANPLARGTPRSLLTAAGTASIVPVSWRRRYAPGVRPTPYHPATWEPAAAPQCEVPVGSCRPSAPGGARSVPRRWACPIR